MIWITNEASKQSIIDIFLDPFQFPEKIFAQFRLHLNGSPVNYALIEKEMEKLKLLAKKAHINLLDLMFYDFCLVVQSRKHFHF